MNIVIFGEIEKAMCNYYQRRGVSFLLYDQFEKNKLEKTNDKKDVVVVAQPQQRRHRRYSDESYNSYEDDEDYQEDYEEGEDVYVEKPVEVEKKEEATDSEEKKFYHYKDDIVYSNVQLQPYGDMQVRPLVGLYPQDCSHYSLKKYEEKDLLAFTGLSFDGLRSKTFIDENVLAKGFVVYIDD